jgi:16S rRNA (adenine(1408)-N(1))-methyltransferase
VVRTALREPTTLAIGVDADAASMRETSRRAARAAKKGGLPNALFVVAAVEALPDELHAIADDVRVTFPWGSLLRGVVGADATVLAGIARVAKPGGEVRAMFSVTELDGLDITDAIYRAAFERYGLRVIEERPATADEIAATGSSWAKRLRAGVDRPVTLVRAVRLDR